MADLPGHLGRRDLGKLAAAGVALAGLGACGQRPREKIFPYVRRPAEVVPGTSTHYATSMVQGGFAVGVLAESREGRPIKIAGNPEHPASLGAAGVLEQASILSLYAPERLRSARGPDGPRSLDAVLAELGRACRSGPPPWFVFDLASSPSLAGVLGELEAAFPDARVVFHAPLDRAPLGAASEALFGRPLDVQHRFERADVVLALGADFVARMPMSLRYARDFSTRRRPRGPEAMSRLYVAETTLTPTGSVADERAAVRPSALARLAADVLREVARHPALAGRAPEGFAGAFGAAEPPAEAAFVRAVAHDLATAGRALVLAGPEQPSDVQLLALALNALLGSPASFLTESALLRATRPQALAELARTPADALGAVVLVGANPVYSAPELGLEALLRRVPSSFCLAPVPHETARACRFVLPEAHYLETWDDARAFDGTWSLAQPLVEPRFPALSALELTASVARGVSVRGHELVRRSHAALQASDMASEEVERAWTRDVERGFVAESAAPEVRAEPDWSQALATYRRVLERGTSAPLELCWQHAPHLDVCRTPNPWLLELPHPLTKQCWGNAALLGPRTAGALGAVSGDVLALRTGGRTLEMPAFVLEGHAEGALTLELGLGHDAPELPSHGVGVNALGLGAGPRHGGVAVSVALTGRHESLAVTQEHGRAAPGSEPPVLTLAELEAARGPSPAARSEERARRSLLAAPPLTGRQWAMTIDTTLCTGCSACVIACQAENNVPVVGRRGVELSREMHWLRIDRYFTGGRERRARVVHQPMACQHCEKAPCEAVCPVNATVHSPDGLNEMVYNRCIGTRFCSNNCPYKVRRFNWFDLSAPRGPEILARNPEVTVRERGVMEKCTYCVQRIRGAEKRARIERRPLRSGEVRTACQETCPTRAIEFGSLDDAGSEMVLRRQEPHAFEALGELGTRPRTHYLAKVVNPSPERTP